MFRVFGRARAERNKAQQNEEALRAMLLSQGMNVRSSEGAKKAIAYCELCINDYEDWFEWNEARWVRWQIIAIVGGVVATLAGVITIPPNWLDPNSALNSFGWIRGVPAAIVTIAAGFLSSFTYREDAVRHELTAIALWNELAKFQSCAVPYNNTEAEDTSIFLNTVCRLVETEVHNWSALVREGRLEGTRPTAPSKGHRPVSGAPQPTPSAPKPGVFAKDV